MSIPNTELTQTHPPVRISHIDYRQGTHPELHGLPEEVVCLARVTLTNRGEVVATLLTPTDGPLEEWVSPWLAMRDLCEAEIAALRHAAERGLGGHEGVIHVTYPLETSNV